MKSPTPLTLQFSKSQNRASVGQSQLAPYDQYSSLIGKEFQYRGLITSEIFGTMLVNNIQIIGNCLGKTEDLQNAIQDYASGSFNVAIDVFSGKQVGEFFERTYNAKHRFGKVVYRYD